MQIYQEMPLRLVNEILLHVQPEFCLWKNRVVICYSWTTAKEFVWDTLKELERVGKAQ